MPDNFKQLFSQLSDIEIPAGLADKITSEINRRQRRMIFIKSSLFVGAAVVSGFLLFLATASTRVAFMESGFVQYLSLLFSDASVVLQSSSSFFYVLAQTLPAFKIAVTTGVLIMFLLTLKWSLQSLKKVTLTHNI